MFEGNRPKRACLIVLGDIGRSPRMQYHSKSFAENNFLVDFVGYLENPPIQEVLDNPRINIHKMHEFPEFYLPRILKYLFKVLWQILSIMNVFLRLKKPDYVVCQNPPGVPTLLMCYFYCKITQAKFVIDWHNYTHTNLALQTSPSSKIVRIAKYIESTFGRKSDLNFCVTEAMKDDLKLCWNIDAHVLYDRPPSQFRSISVEEKHHLYLELSNRFSEFRGSTKDSSIFTDETESGEIILKPNRPGLLISSTSWTQDEDFGILLTALKAYEKTASSDKNQEYPNLICVITGKGPMKAFYQAKIAEIEWKRVKIMTPWLENEEYPVLLAASDLGVCLHFSTSGLDLPMKVVDMFGCGLPVCAMNFKCITELVRDGENGFIFDNEEELTDQIQNWFHKFPKNSEVISLKEKFSKNLEDFQALRWKENWEQTVLPLF